METLPAHTLREFPFLDSLAKQLQLPSGNIVKMKTALRFSFSPFLLHMSGLCWMRITMAN